MFMSIISDDNQPTINDTIAIEKPDVFIFDKDIDNSVQIKELLETGKYKYVFFGGDSIEQYQEINDVRYL
ncbi:MAG: hypothetical protein DRP42_00820 [Tenericutes bacterium]|nr:MAG: hypothetical protein DRP42_00820 [Mycoplasmatota bacterium]